MEVTIKEYHTLPVQPRQPLHEGLLLLLPLYSLVYQSCREQVASHVGVSKGIVYGVELRGGARDRRRDDLEQLSELLTPHSTPAKASNYNFSMA